MGTHPYCSPGHRVLSQPPPDIEFSLALPPLAMAFKFASLLAFVTYAAVVSGRPTKGAATCSDGTKVSNEVCCDFIPVRAPLVDPPKDIRSKNRSLARYYPAGDALHERLR